MAAAVKTRHYEKFAQREQAPKLFDTSNPMCAVFNQGLQECAYNQAAWPTVWFSEQNQHCIALLNIVTHELELLERPDILPVLPSNTTSPEFKVHSKSSVTVHNNNTLGINTTAPLFDRLESIAEQSDWFGFGVGLGCGIIGYVVLVILRYCIQNVPALVSKIYRSVWLRLGDPPQVQFAYVRGAPARIDQQIAVNIHAPARNSQNSNNLGTTTV